MATPEKRFYYGWVIVAIGFCTMLLVQGSFASSGVLFAALTQKYGWSRATISLSFSVALVGYASLTCGTCLCLSGLACLTSLSPAAPGWLPYGYAVAYGLGFGVHGTVESTATADIFHGPYLGAILGAAVSPPAPLREEIL